jgi:uncharacterized membrane protein YqjE
MHPLLRLLTRRPELLAEHAQAYAELAAAELTVASGTWRRQLLLNILALACLCGAALLGGVALMLWAVMPVATSTAAWVLWCVPLLPAVIGLVCGAAAQRSPGSTASFHNLRQQLKTDAALLRTLAKT